MQREIKKYALDFDKTIEYFTEHAICEKTLSQYILKRIDFKKGSFFTMLPTTTDMTNLYQFEWGGIIPSIPLNARDPYPKQVITTGYEVSSFISSFLTEEKNHYCLVEDYVLTPDSPFAHQENVRTITYKNEVHFLLTRSNSIEEIEKAVIDSDAMWHSLTVLFSMQEDIPDELTIPILERLCDQTRYIITGAYDGESYVIWERST